MAQPTPLTAELTAIGLIHSPFKTKVDAPPQGRNEMVTGTIEIFEQYESALLDIDRCTHLFVLYWQDRGDRGVLQSRTHRGPEIHGVFSTRSPNRPNPIGLCVVDLVSQKGRLLEVKGLDALDGSALIDIKPYATGIDAVEGAQIGWRKEKNAS